MIQFIVMSWDSVVDCTAGARFYLHLKPSDCARYTQDQGFSPMPGMDASQTLCGLSADWWAFWIDRKRMKPCRECTAALEQLKLKEALRWHLVEDDGEPVERAVPTQGDIRKMMAERVAKRPRKRWQSTGKQRSARLRRQMMKATAHTRARQERFSDT